MPTQQPKAAIAAIEDPLLKAYADAWEQILEAQQQIAADPLRWRQKRRLAELQRAIENKMAELDAKTREWVTSELVRPYALGAAAGAVELEQSAAAVWTLLPHEAISRVAADTMDELLKSTRYVRRTTKTLIRAIGRDQVLAKLTQGQTAVDAGRRMAQILEQHQIHAIRYADGSRHGLKEYAEMLVRTKTGMAYNLGTLEAQEVLGVGFWECFDGPSCGLSTHQDPRKALGMIVDKDTALQYPLSHPNAIMEDSAVRAIGGYKAIYRAKWSGPVYQVRTAAGARMTVGPNHPVLTLRGWLAAELLREGDHVLSRADHGQVTQVPADVDLNQMQAAISDVFATLRHSGSHTRVVPAADDFHGDGEFCQGEVDVVAIADHFLPVVPEAQSVERSSEDRLMAAAMRSNRHGLGTESLGGGGVNLSTTGVMSRGHVGGVAGTWTDFDASLAEAITDWSAGAPELGSQLLCCSPREVLLDEVVEVRLLESWEGHAYDLETGTGVYWCNGILVHNCRRSWGARPDVKTKAHAEQANSNVTAEQTADQAAADQERSRAQEARRYQRRQLRAPKPVSRETARETARASAGASLTAARRGDVRIPVRRRRRR